jgi:hypothetical protein
MGVLLGGCGMIGGAPQDEVVVAGDYQSLSSCLRGELALQQFDVEMAMDPADKRARIWRELPGGRISAEQFSVMVTQTDPKTVTIGVRHAGLAYAQDNFMVRLSPMLERCEAAQKPRGSAA